MNINGFYSQQSSCLVVLVLHFAKFPVVLDTVMEKRRCMGRVCTGEIRDRHRNRKYTLTLLVRCDHRQCRSVVIMQRECSSAHCSEQNKKGSDFSFHCFPSNPQIQRQWQVKMNRVDPKTKKLWKPKPHDVLCSKHFDDSCFTARTRFCKDNNQPYKAMLELDPVPIPSLCT